MSMGNDYHSLKILHFNIMQSLAIQCKFPSSLLPCVNLKNCWIIIFPFSLMKITLFFWQKCSEDSHSSNLGTVGKKISLIENGQGMNGQI